jgi:hypothetical protein
VKKKTAVFLGLAALLYWKRKEIAATLTDVNAKLTTKNYLTGSEAVAAVRG